MSQTATEEEVKKEKPSTLEKMAKYGGKVRKALETAFNPSATEGEAIAAFLAAKMFMNRVEVGITEMIRPEFGAGPLIVALQRVGQTIMPSGTYEGKTLIHVMNVEPEYMLACSAAGGFRDPVANADIKTVANAYMQEMFCQLSGDWENIQEPKKAA